MKLKKCVGIQCGLRSYGRLEAEIATVIPSIRHWLPFGDLAQYSSTQRRSDERALNTRHVDLKEVAKAIAKVLPGADKLNHEQ